MQRNKITKCCRYIKEKEKDPTKLHTSQMVYSYEQFKNKDYEYFWYGTEEEIKEKLRKHNTYATKRKHI